MFSLQLYERHTKHAVGREIAVMQALNEKFMSDEETDSEDSNSFLKCSPTWRSDKLNRLIQKLDKRYFDSRKKRDNSKPLKSRKNGAPSKRLQPACTPKWAIAITLEGSCSDSPTVSDISPDESASGCPTTVTSNPSSPVTSQDSDAGSSLNQLSDIESDSDMDLWMYQVTGLQN